MQCGKVVYGVKTLKGLPNCVPNCFNLLWSFEIWWIFKTDVSHFFRENGKNWKKKSKIGDFDFVISKQSGRYPIQNIHKNTPQILRMPDIIRFGPSFGWFLSLYVVYDPSQNRVFATSHVFGALYQNYIKKFQLLLPQLLRSWDKFINFGQFLDFQHTL